MSDTALPAFAVKLKSLREAAGLTQAQLAERSGLHLGAVFKIEQGKREPSWATVQALAVALGVNCLAFSEAAEVQDDAAEQPAPKQGRPRKAAVEGVATPDAKTAAKKKGKGKGK